MRSLSLFVLIFSSLTKKKSREKIKAHFATILITPRCQLILAHATMKMDLWPHTEMQRLDFYKRCLFIIEYMQYTLYVDVHARVQGCKNALSEIEI